MTVTASALVALAPVFAAVRRPLYLLASIPVVAAMSWFGAFKLESRGTISPGFREYVLAGLDALSVLAGMATLWLVFYAAVNWLIRLLDWMLAIGWMAS